MQKNVIIDFMPKCTYKDWIFKNNPERDCDLFSKKQLEEMIDDSLSRIPERLLAISEILNWEIIITNKRNLEKECGALQEIYGYTNFNKKEIVVYANKKGIYESLPHEFAHLFDSLTEISNTEEWKNICKKEKEKFKSMPMIFTAIEYPSECFADSFLAFIFHNATLKSYTLDTYIIMERIIKYINYILDDDYLEKYKNIEKEKEEKLIKSLIGMSCFSDEYNYL